MARVGLRCRLSAIRTIYGSDQGACKSVHNYLTYDIAALYVQVKVPVNFTAGRAAALAVPTSNKAGTLVLVTSGARYCSVRLLCADH